VRGLPPDRASRRRADLHATAPGARARRGGARGAPLAAGERVAEVHAFRRLGGTFVLDVETMQCYETTPAVAAVVEALAARRRGAPAPAHRPAARAVRPALDHLRRIGIVTPAPPRLPRLARRAGIRHLELMVTHACTLRCRYCYGAATGAGSRHLYGEEAAEMPLDVALQSVEMLLRCAGGAPRVSLTFFGGEPLLALDLIRRVVPYARERAAAAGKRLDLSLSTNGIGLSAEAVDLLVANDIGCQVSIDGPPELHDANRVTAAGAGSYALALPGIRRLLAARPGRVTARVTVAHGRVRLPEVVEHLLGLGFGAVHVEPALGGCGGCGVDAGDVAAMCEQNEALARVLVARVRADRVFAYHNLVRHVRSSRVVRRRLAHHCGAARTLLAVARDGGVYPCHRFVGMAAYRMGDVRSGPDLALQRRVLGLTVDDRPGCRECWARYLCGGGCWKHAVDAHGDLERPDEALACRLIRHQIECALAVNAALPVSDAEVLGRRWRQGVAPHLAPEEE